MIAVEFRSIYDWVCLFIQGAYSNTVRDSCQEFDYQELETEILGEKIKCALSVLKIVWNTPVLHKSSSLARYKRFLTSVEYCCTQGLHAVFLRVGNMFSGVICNVFLLLLLPTQRNHDRALFWTCRPALYMFSPRISTWAFFLPSTYFSIKFVPKIQEHFLAIEQRFR